VDYCNRTPRFFPPWHCRPAILWQHQPSDQPVANPADGSEARQIGAIEAVPFFEQPVELSPDLRRIAYVKETGQPTENMRELHLAANDGTGDWLYAKGVRNPLPGLVA